MSSRPRRVAFTDPFFCVVDGEYIPEEAQLERSLLGAETDMVLGNWNPSTRAFNVDDDSLLELAEGADVLVVYRARLSRDVVKQLPRSVRLVIRQGDGLDNIPVADVLARGLYLCNVPDYCVSEASTHALALILSHERGIVEQHLLLSSGSWGPLATRIPRRTETLTLGIVGVGRVGRAVIDKGRAFFNRILATDPAVHADQIIASGAEPATFAELMRRSHYVSLHADLNESSLGMINAESLSEAPQGVVLVNTARGQLVDEKDMLFALGDGRVGAYLSDVFPTEPVLPGGALARLGAKHFVGTCHRGFLSDTAMRSLRLRAMEQAAHYLSTAEPPTYGRVR